jgi:AcrR family transcriptional regulator
MGKVEKISEKAPEKQAEKPAEKQDAEGARKILIETASQIMREGDTVDISFSDLSHRSGLNSALVKYYFGNKDGLLLAVLDRDMRLIVEDVKLLVAKTMPAEDKLRLHIGAVVDTYARFPYLNRLLMRMIRDLPPKDARHIADTYLKPLSDAYAEFIKQGVDTGVFKPVEPGFFYFTVTGAADRFFTGNLVWKYCYDSAGFDAKVREAYKQHTVDLIMAGILKS